MSRSRLLSAAVAAAVAAAVGIVLLCTLGIWQLERLAWKEALLAQIEARLKAPPVSIDDVMKSMAGGGDVEFVKVAGRGQFLQSQSKLLIASFDGGVGWDVVTPLLMADDTVMLVDRGIIPGDQRATATQGTGETSDVTGIIRRHGAPRGTFSPDNDVAGNNWYWWDVPAMLSSIKSPDGARPLPVVLQLLPVEGDRSFPRPQAPSANLSNNHLQYAITWFALAAVLALIAFIFIRGQMKKTAA